MAADMANMWMLCCPIHFTPDIGGKTMIFFVVLLFLANIYSEGLQIEYVAIFLAVLFPGALVALNYDLLQNLPLFSMLRIYCAGIWHNITLCAVCVLTTLLLPLVLYPFYIHGEGLMVMGVSQTSPLLGYLSSHDVIVSMDGLNITRTDEWIKMLAQDNAGRTSNPDSLEGSQSYGATSSGKGYRVPNSWMEASKNLWQINGNLSCPDELIAFERTSCNGSTILSVSTGAGSDKEAEDRYCLIAKDVVKLKKCGTGWQRNKADGNNCICSKDEYCMVPALSPGVSWIEISYTRPYSLECLQLKGNSSSVDATNNSPGPSPCGGTFVYVGDLLSAAHSVKLSSYRPRWMLLLFTAYVPYILENTFGCLFRVSAALAVVNCLPVYFLDGEAILETILCYIPWFIRRQRHKIFEVCRFLWTVLSVITFSRILYSVTLDFGHV